MLSILNSVSSLQAENALSNTTSALNKNLQQLSTGLRINSGADDAAGLSIANGLQANIAAISQSSQNASEGVGMLQTADGALSQVTTLLNRAITLATEASNGGLSARRRPHSIPNIRRSRPRSTTLALQRTSTGRRFSVRGNVFESDGTTTGTISDRSRHFRHRSGLTTRAHLSPDGAGRIARIALIATAISTVAADRGDVGAPLNQLPQAKT